MTKSFFRDAAAGIVTFDLGQPDSLASVEQWLHDFRDFCPSAYVVLVGNKVDLGGERVVSQAEAQGLADRYVLRAACP